MEEFTGDSMNKDKNAIVMLVLRALCKIKGIRVGLGNKPRSLSLGYNFCVTDMMGYNQVLSHIQLSRFLVTFRDGMLKILWWST